MSAGLWPRTAATPTPLGPAAEPLGDCGGTLVSAEQSTAGECGSNIELAVGARVCGLIEHMLSNVQWSEDRLTGFVSEAYSASE